MTEPIADTARIASRRQWPLPKQADPKAPLLRVTDLKTHFKLDRGWLQAVDGVSFGLNDGEALGLAGESGCGKTTTALSLVRLLPSNGRIRSGNVPCASLYNRDGCRQRRVDRKGRVCRRIHQVV